MLKITSTDDYQVKVFESNVQHNVMVFLYSLMCTLFYLIIALPGFIVNVPLGILLNNLSEKERIKVGGWGDRPESFLLLTFAACGLYCSVNASRR